MYSIPCFRTVPVRLSVARASTVLHLPDAIFSMSRQNRKKESNSGYMKSKWTLHIKKKPSLDTLVTFNSSFRSAKSVAGTSFLVAFFAWFSYKSGRTYDVMQKLKITCRTSGGTTVNLKSGPAQAHVHAHLKYAKGMYLKHAKCWVTYNVL